MWIQYASDGEITALMQLSDLIANFDETGGWHNTVSGNMAYADDMRRELEERGWFTGYHDCGHYLVLNLDKLQLTSRLQPAPMPGHWAGQETRESFREAMQELQARKRMDQQDMQAEGERDEDR